MIHITLNGQPQTVPTTSTISTLLASLELTHRRLAVERNGEIVPRSCFPTTNIEQNDFIEIVIAVGGG